MRRINQIPLETNIISAERTPDILFVCLAKIEPKAGEELKSAFDTGAGMSKDLRATYNKHLMYAYDVGEKGLYWEAGPSADFTEILFIFSTGSLEEARKIMHSDPLYKEKVFHGDWWLQWVIHCPIWKASEQHLELLKKNSREFGIIPAYPEGVKPQEKEIQVRSITPPKLIATIARLKAKYIEEMTQDMETGRPLPIYFLDHVFYTIGVGGIGQMGYYWEGGPTSDWNYDISIFSVNSIETAHFLAENDSFTKYEIFHDRRYFEWYIHMPFKKVSPAHREPLKRFLTGAGVSLPAE